jgi:hypothetical protein
MSYVRVYEIPLLDDIHNYFPDILYNSSRFVGVQDLLLYIQEQTRSRFNLFDYGQRQYARAAQPPPTPVRPAQRRTTEEVHVEFATPDRLVTSILGSIRPPRIVRQTPLFEDVIVHASEDAIERASTSTTLEQDLDTTCTVCQETMRQGELVRTLTACSHQFHRSCIDNWLLRESVVCPTCRHDVREPARRPGQPSPVLMAQTGSAQLSHQQPVNGLINSRRAREPDRDITPAESMISQALINALLGEHNYI